MPARESSASSACRPSGRHRREEAWVQRRVLIMGAAGRDFHNFNSAFRGDPATRVVAFTATQIP